MDHPNLAELPYLLYAVILAACVCLVFAVASIFDSPIAAAGLRRTASTKWAVTKFSNKLVPNDNFKHDTLKIWLSQAGYTAPNAVEIYFGIRVLAAFAFLVVALLALPLYSGLGRTQLLIIWIGAGIIGFLAPVLVVRSRLRSRQRKFREGMPDVLDLLLVCSESGLGLDAAIMKVAQELTDVHPLLAAQLFIVSRELQAGRDRKDAIRGFATRTGIDESISLVNLLIQSDALGTSIVHALRTYAADMRARRLFKAEEQGQKASVKLTVVLVVFFLPAIFAVIVVPALYTALKGMTSIASISLTTP